MLFDWWKKRGTPEPQPLTGAPAVRRQKSYSAQSGYVYQYYYEGHRPAAVGVEYVFNVSADRKTSFPVSVTVETAAVQEWQTAHQRPLNGTEEYAVAKMALFQAFDDRADPAHLHQPVKVGAAQIEAILETLDLD